MLDHAYHVNTTSLIDPSPYKFNGPGGDGKPPHVQVAPAPDVFRGPHRGGDAANAYAAGVAEALSRAERQGNPAGLFPRRVAAQLRGPDQPAGRIPSACLPEPVRGLSGTWLCHVSGGDQTCWYDNVRHD